jgi:hypothetical protein
VDKVKTEIISIMAIAWLETIALLKGVDGAYFSTVIATIGAIAGYHIGRTRKRRR